jgi:hypothetical protein
MTISFLLQPKTKMMLIVFFNYEDVMQHEYTFQGHTVNHYLHLKVLRYFHDTINHKQQQKWESSKWKIHPDSAPVHTAQLVWKFVAKHNIPQVRQHPCSLDMTLCDFYFSQT